MGEADPRENVQLIAYSERFGGSLTGLHKILGPLERLFAGVHVLLFFTPFDGADAGFDPVDHAEVDPRLGSWDDARDLAGEYAVMVDLIVNHVSADSASSATCSPAATPRHTRECS
jgi:sucrose phosphorylase